MDLAPYQVSFFNTETNPSEDLKDLKLFLTSLALEEDIKVHSDVKDFNGADDLGIPYVVLLK